jgi:(p)ppGpp synthase/HD superfamily hydrolase
MDHYLKLFSVDLGRRCGATSVSHRAKHPRSVARKKISGRQVRDIWGVRLIHPRPYAALDALGRQFLEDDYIESPKAGTGYQALHLSIPSPWFEEPVEVQVLTEEMYLTSCADGYHVRNSMAEKM